MLATSSCEGSAKAGIATVVDSTPPNSVGNCGLPDRIAQTEPLAEPRALGLGEVSGAGDTGREAAEEQAMPGKRGIAARDAGNDGNDGNDEIQIVAKVSFDQRMQRKLDEAKRDGRYIEVDGDDTGGG